MSALDDMAHEFVEGLVPIGAAATWNAVAQASPQHIASWDDQDGSTRARFVDAFTVGLEAMSDAAGGER